MVPHTSGTPTDFSVADKVQGGGGVARNVPHTSGTPTDFSVADKVQGGGGVARNVASCVRGSLWCTVGCDGIVATSNKLPTTAPKHETH